MQQAGYESSKLAENTIMLVLSIGLTATILILTLLLAVCLHRLPRVYSKLKSIWRGIFWNAILRTSLEISLDTVIACMIHYYSFSFEDVGAGTPTVVSLLIMAYFTGLMLWIPCFLRRQDEKTLDSDEFKSKFGSISELYKAELPAARLFNSIFLGRRIILAALLVYAKAYPFMQAVAFTVCTTFQVMYQGLASP